ncbi:helix-turn-helix domain-containing protein [Spirillospora sp. NBC_01491]|uniref:helix-turn-helix domain-containing protein n=1 Tax=Spirillospora sp. NBC_01491 TaxID=2976007 RepID=UPI002E32455C|nr:helix-turn-helix domain-containing protein [Spirillospora sp. NBC_01491]
MERDDGRRLIPWWPDAGRALGIGRTKIYQLIRTGDLPSVTIGRRRLIAVRDLDDYVEGRRAAGQQGGEAA